MQIKLLIWLWANNEIGTEFCQWANSTLIDCLLKGVIIDKNHKKTPRKLTCANFTNKPTRIFYACFVYYICVHIVNIYPA